MIIALVAPAAAGAAGTTNFSVRPGHFDPADPVTRAYFKHELVPGASFADDVVVTNAGTTPVTLRVYPVDGLTGQTSGAVYANRGQRRHKAGTWVHVGVSRIVVQPHTQTTVAFTVHAPARAVPGDHLAGIAFENAHASTSGSSFRVRQILREVVGVLVRVPGPAHARLRLGTLSLATVPGTRLGSVIVPIADVGRLLCKPNLTVRLSSSGRRQLITRRLDTVLPGDRIAYPLILQHALPPSTYLVHASAACAQSRATMSTRVVLGAKLAGTRDAPTPSPVAAASPSHSGSPVPWAFVFVEVGVVAAAVAGLALVLRRRRPFA